MLFARRLFATAILGCLAPALALAEPHASPDAPAATEAAPSIATADAPAQPPPAAPAPVAAAKPTPPAKPAVTLQAKVDLASQTLTVIERGRTLATWKISSGVEDHATPRGVFQPEWTAKMWYSHTYDGAPMPHAVFFKDGAAIHATQWTGALGRAASHGCVRLAPANAETFYKLIQRHGLAHARITVFGTPPPSRQYLARHDAKPLQRTARYGNNATNQAANAAGRWGGNYQVTRYTSESIFAPAYIRPIPYPMARTR